MSPPPRVGKDAPPLSDGSAVEWQASRGPMVQVMGWAFHCIVVCTSLSCCMSVNTPLAVHSSHAIPACGDARPPGRFAPVAPFGLMNLWLPTEARCASRPLCLCCYGGARVGKNVVHTRCMHTHASPRFEGGRGEEIFPGGAEATTAPTTSSVNGGCGCPSYALPLWPPHGAGFWPP